MKLESSYRDIGYLDLLARQRSFIHQLDPRAKVLTTLVFMAFVISFDKYSVTALIPFVLYPVISIALGNLPPGYLLRKMLVATPFAFFVGIFNPLFDQEVLVHLGNVGISGGWISFASIMIRFCLTVSAALILIASTGFDEVCLALRRTGIPAVLCAQFLFLYRYLFVLVDEASRMTRARAMRSFNGRGMGMKVFGFMIGQLLLRTIDRARRIHLAMLCRGFDGELRLVRSYRLSRRDVAYVLGWSMLFVLMRRYDVPQLIGGLVLRSAG
ncbi:MAG TPA: cobalt ECF transporter T component CbiQ [Syntrophobacteraceae bacterium]|nr:cobalt ECF transporter T component CbiQ [Syntrophobacteraceae bacterium]